MGAYQYVAVDTGGKEHRGILEGDTPKHVRQLLRDRHLLPVEVAEVEAEERRSRRQFTASDLVALSRPGHRPGCGEIARCFCSGFHPLSSRYDGGSGRGRDRPPARYRELGSS